MLNIKDNSNLVFKAFQKFLGTQDSKDFVTQIGIWIFGYVTRKLRASEDEASLVFLNFWSEQNKFIQYINLKGCKNLFGFLAFCSRNLLIKVRRSEQDQESIQQFVALEERGRITQTELYASTSSHVILRYAIRKLSILNRIILCFRYGIKLTKTEKEFLMSFLDNENKYHQILSEFESRIKQQNSKSLRIIEKLNHCHWKISYSSKGLNLFINRKRKLQNELIKIDEIFSIKEIADYLGISKYKIKQSCEHSIQFIRRDLDVANQLKKIKKSKF